MSPEVVVSSWAVWNAAGISVNAAPHRGAGRGLAPGPAPPPPEPRQGRPRPALATALVQLVSRLVSARHGLGPELDVQRRLDLRLGTAIGSRTVDLEFQETLHQRGAAFGSPSTFAYTLSTAPLGEVAVSLGLRGALSTVSCGRASGLVSIVTAAAGVAAGRSAACVCGGFEVSGTESDMIALFLLEPAWPTGRRPRLTDWGISFEPDSPPDDGAGTRPTLESVADALVGRKAIAFESRALNGQCARLTVAPFPTNAGPG